MKLLLTQGADTKARDAESATPLCVAAREGHSDVVSALVSFGADVNASCTDEWTALMRAARGNHTRTIEFLANHGANINQRSISGYTALMSAARWGCADAVHALHSGDRRSLPHRTLAS